MGKGPTLREIADRITVHLKRFEADPTINVYDKPGGTSVFFNPSAWPAGSMVRVRTKSYWGGRALKKADALAYLVHLDAGNVDTVSAWEIAANGASNAC